MDSIQYMKMAVFQELKEALQVKQINDELLEYLSSAIRWLLHYEKKYNFNLPEKEKMLEILEYIMDIDKKLPPTFKHPNTTPEDSTEPKFLIRSF